MKAQHKIILTFAVCFIISFYTGAYISNIIKNPTDFKVYQTFVMDGGNFESVRLRVVSNVNNYDKDTMIKKIKLYSIWTYGITDSLYIELYNSEDDFKNNKLAVKYSN